MKKKLLSFAFLFLTSFCFSQDHSKIIDSLKTVIFKKPSDSIKIKAYGDLCWYYRTESIDSAFKYGNLALKLSKETSNQVGEAQAYNDIGILHYNLADYKKALKYYDASLKIRSVLKDTMGIAALYSKIGLIHQNTFKLDSAIFYATKALKIYEEKNHTRYIAYIKSNIANIYRGLKQYQKALETHLEIADVNKSINDNLGLTRTYNNIANAYLFLKDTVQSEAYYLKSIDLALKYNYKKELAGLYNNYGGILHDMKKYLEAIDYNTKSLKLREELKDSYGITSTSLHLAGLYLDLGDFNKARNYLYEGLNLSKSFNINELKMDAYDKLASYYAFKRIPDSVLYYRQLFKSINDTIYNSRITKEIAEVQEKYNSAEREKEIQTQRAEIAEKELKLNRKNTQIIGLVTLALLLFLLGYLLYNQQKLRNKQLQKESELRQALVEIETHNKLQEQRLRISRDLHDNIGAQLTFIISSIENLQYGFKITNNKLKGKLTDISAFTKETINELRDTIWAMNKNEITLEDLQARISNFIDKANISASNSNFRFNMDEALSKELVFTSVRGMNIYRIIQEAVNNAIKYADASNIEIHIKKKYEAVVFTISDNGIGFDINEIEAGNGLSNMKKRANDMDATIIYKSQIRKGTKIILSV
ncbi:tetratricopeptide repeat protein [Seonamhaeicola sediminis]|uniref:Tetratricopeptide repeat protein n=1 Tax=Seonamhaeicola sediminis TaxID=2528206 RepID=A0A562YHC7_9FLAO|nr:sensor histidine kinase [Seonamhaeicola sediminis]TWO34466.1 tetratricopeptide repeat protein [Seonamhaeicola sediminis]